MHSSHVLLSSSPMVAHEKRCCTCLEGRRIIRGTGLSDLFEFGEKPSLSSEDLFVDAPFGGHSFLALLSSGVFAPRHHHSPAITGLAATSVDRCVAGRRSQRREEQAAPRFRRVGPSARRGPDYGRIG